MLYDYGASNLSVSSVAMENYIDQIINNFTVIIIQDQFDESLVVLKNKLCWDWSDIMYVSANKGHYKFDKTNETLMNERRKKHVNFSPYDYRFYEKALKKLETEKRNINQFELQLEEFRKTKDKITKWCSSQKVIGLTVFEIETNYTKSRKTTFSRNDCKHMQINVLDFIDEILEKRYGIN